MGSCCRRGEPQNNERVGLLTDVSSDTSHASNTPRRTSKFKNLVSKCHNVHDIQNALKKCGLKYIKLIIGIDYSESNRDNGGSIHSTRPGTLNPYQEIIDVVSRTLSIFVNEDPSLIHAFGFGDMSTKDKSVFPFFLSRTLTSRPCKGSEEVLKRYIETTRNIILSKPTSFAPLIREAIKIVQEVKTFHLLMIISPGHIDNMVDTQAAILEASKYPLSILVVGVGEGPWSEMYELCEDRFQERAFENFHFVSYASALEKAQLRDLALSSSLVEEIPTQLRAIKKLGYNYRPM